jgi:hypothetical protein
LLIVIEVLTSTTWAVGKKPVWDEELEVKNEQKTEVKESLKKVKVESKLTSQIAKKRIEAPINQRIQVEEYVPEVIIEAKWYLETKIVECLEKMVYENKFRHQVFLSWSREIYGKFKKEPIEFGFNARGKFGCIAPQALAWDIKGDLYLLDIVNWQVLKFSHDKKYLKTIKLKKLSGVKICYTEAIHRNIIAIDANQYIYIYTFGEGKFHVLKYSPEGEFIKSICTFRWDGIDGFIGDLYTTVNGEVIASIYTKEEKYYKSLSFEGKKYPFTKKFEFIREGKGYYFNTPTTDLIQVMLDFDWVSFKNICKYYLF